MGRLSTVASILSMKQMGSIVIPNPLLQQLKDFQPWPSDALWACNLFPTRIEAQSWRETKQYKAKRLPSLVRSPSDTVPCSSYKAIHSANLCLPNSAIFANFFSQHAAQSYNSRSERISQGKRSSRYSNYFKIYTPLSLPSKNSADSSQSS